MKRALSLLAIVLLLGTAFAMNAEMREQIKGIERYSEPDPTIKLKLGDKFEDLKIEDLTGNVVETAVLRKDKLLILRLVNAEDVLWEKETEILNRVAEQFMTKVAILDVVVPSLPPQMALKQYENARAAFFVAYDKENLAVKQLGIAEKEIPSTFIFDQQGRLISFGRSFSKTLPDRLEKFFAEIEGKKAE